MKRITINSLLVEIQEENWNEICDILMEVGIIPTSGIKQIISGSNDPELVANVICYHENQIQPKWLEEAYNRFLDNSEVQLSIACSLKAPTRVLEELISSGITEEIREEAEDTLRNR